MMRRWLVLLAASAAVACGSDDDSGDGSGSSTPTGTATFTFELPDGVRNSSALVDELTGTIYGNVYLAKDVTITGPKDDAPQFYATELPGVDLTTPTAAGPVTSDPLEPGVYVWLGFFDVDGNGATENKPDPGDPVTLATTNQFTIEGNDSVDLTVAFDLVLN